MVAWAGFPTPCDFIQSAVIYFDGAARECLKSPGTEVTISSLYPGANGAPGYFL